MTGELKCKVCGSLGDCNGTIPKCANCWEVEKRLDLYIKSPQGRAFALMALGLDTPPPETRIKRFLSLGVLENAEKRPRTVKTLGEFLAHQIDDSHVSDAMGVVVFETPGGQFWRATIDIDIACISKSDAEALIGDDVEDSDENPNVIVCRIGDSGDYHTYDDVESLADALRESNVRWPLARHMASRMTDPAQPVHYGGVVDDGDFQSNNYISLFWGTDAETMVSDITDEELTQINRLIFAFRKA